MDWDALRFALAVAREQTLSGAGTVLGVAHSTVGRRLTRLEKELGVRLFDRTPEGFRATDAGLEILELAEEMEARFYAVEGSLRGQDLQLEGPLRVSTLDYLFEAYAPVFVSFRAAFPGIALTVTSTETEVSLFRREADIVLRMTNSPPETVVGRRVGEVPFAIYGHRDLVSGNQGLSSLPWLGWDERLEGHQRWFDGFLSEVAPGARVVMRLGESTLVRRAALLAGIGVHPLPCLEGDRFAELVRIGPPLPEITRQLWLLTLPALRDNRRVRAFLSHFVQAMRT